MQLKEGDLALAYGPRTESDGGISSNTFLLVQALRPSQSSAALPHHLHVLQSFFIPQTVASQAQEVNLQLPLDNVT